MRFKLLGQSGVRVSEICLGTMTFGPKWGWGASKEDSRQIFDNFVDEGGNFIDTSCNYTDGESESFIGEFILGDRDRYVIATKYTLHDYRYRSDPNAGGNSRKNLIRSLKGSLERLKTDYVDILYLHMWDYFTPIKEIMQAMTDVVRAGKVHYIGISDTPAWIVARANTMAEFRGLEPFVVYQFPYSLAYRHAERSTIPLCKNLDLAMAVFGVLRSGLFTGKYTRNIPDKGRLTPDHWGKPSEGAIQIAREVDTIADEIGCPSSHVAINWIRNQEKGVFIPILGATRVSQLQENLSCLDSKLSTEHRNRLDKKLTELTKFELGFAKGWLRGTHDLVYGDTYELVDNHRPYE
ncbi:MAG: aldo/keto reductase [Candidatus Thorarchaeota archaeon]